MGGPLLTRLFILKVIYSPLPGSCYPEKRPVCAKIDKVSDRHGVVKVSVRNCESVPRGLVRIGQR